MSTNDVERLGSLVDDGLAMRPSGAWIKDKYYYLQRYIYAFETAMKDKNWRSRQYIDLFTGPGKCFIKETGEIVMGSSLIALSTEYPFTDYIFVDIEQDNIYALSVRAEAIRPHANIHYHVGDSNELVHSIVQQIVDIDRPYVSGLWPSLNLAFLDPAKINLRWSTVKALASVKRMDMIIHYPRMGLNRAMADLYESDRDTAVDRFFGNRQWRTIYGLLREQGASESQIHHELMNHYKQRLGIFDYVLDSSDLPEPLVRTVESNSPLYNLILVSKHELAYELWRKIAEKGPSGQMRLPL